MKQSTNNWGTVSEKLEEIYARLQQKHMRLFAAFMDSTAEFEDYYSVDHYYRRKDGIFDGASYPLPAFTVPEVCDIIINFDSIDFYVHLDSALPNDVLQRFRIRETISLPGSGLFCFRMAEDEDCSVVLGFAEELRAAGARV